MIICHCHNVTDKQIREIVKKGAKSLKEVGCACEACTECKGCAKAVREIIDEECKK